MKRIAIFLIACIFLLSACSDTKDVSSVDSENTSSEHVSDEAVDSSDVSDDDARAKGVFADSAVFENGQASVSVSFLSKTYNNSDEEDVTDIYRYLLEKMTLSREATEEEIEEHKRYSSVSSYVSNHITVFTSLSLTSSVNYKNRMFEIFDDDCVRWNIDGETQHSVLPDGTYSEICRCFEAIKSKNTLPYSYTYHMRDNIETELSVYYNVSDFKGYELYARLVDDELRFSLLSGTNRLKTKEEVDGYPAATLGEMISILNSYSEFDMEYVFLCTFDDVDLQKFGEEIKILLGIQPAVVAEVKIGRTVSTYKLTGSNARDIYECINNSLRYAEDKSAIDYISDREIYTTDCLTVRIYAATDSSDVFGKFIIYKDNYAYWLESRDTNTPHYYKLPDNTYEELCAIIGSDIIERELNSGEIFDLKDVTDIIEQTSDFETILAKLEQIKPTPDYTGGSGVSLIEYWIDVVGKEKIMIIYEQGEIYHVVDDTPRLIFPASDEDDQSLTAEQEIRAITDAAILERYPETDFADFNVRVSINDDGIGWVHYDLFIGGYRSGFRYYVKLSSEKEILDFKIHGQEYMEFLDKIDINDVRNAELKLDTQIQQYGDQNSGYYLSLDQDGNLCLGCEVIVEYDETDEMYGKGCCFSHDHFFFSEIICYK